MNSIGRRKLTGEQEAVLTECARREAEIAAMPEPPAHRSWEVHEFQELRSYGPRYQPREWFGGGDALPEKYRVRYLRAIHDLAELNLLERFSGSGGRLENVKLTEEGHKVAAELMAPAEPPVKKPTEPEPTAAVVAPVSAAPAEETSAVEGA